MKLLKTILAFLIFVSLQIAAAQWLNVPPPVEAKNLMMFTTGVPVAGGSCNVSTDEIGDRTEYATVSGLAAGYAFAVKHTADCAGTLEDAYLYLLNTSEGQAAAKICVYLAGAGSPTSSDTLLGCSAEINNTASPSADTWYTASIGAGSTTVRSYYVVVVVNAGYNTWNGGQQNATSPLLYTSSGTFNYASPPAEITAGGTLTWSDLGNYGPVSMYVRIQ